MRKPRETSIHLSLQMGGQRGGQTNGDMVAEDLDRVLQYWGVFTEEFGDFCVSWSQNPTKTRRRASSNTWKRELWTAKMYFFTSATHLSSSRVISPGCFYILKTEENFVLITVCLNEETILLWKEDKGRWTETSETGQRRQLHSRAEMSRFIGDTSVKIARTKTHSRTLSQNVNPTFRATLSSSDGCVQIWQLNKWSRLSWLLWLTESLVWASGRKLILPTEKYQPGSKKSSKYTRGFSFISIQASLLYPQKVWNLHKLNGTSDLNLPSSGPFDPACFLPQGWIVESQASFFKWANGTNQRDSWGDFTGVNTSVKGS